MAWLRLRLRRGSPLVGSAHVAPAHRELRGGQGGHTGWDDTAAGAEYRITAPKRGSAGTRRRQERLSEAGEAVTKVVAVCLGFFVFLR